MATGIAGFAGVLAAPWLAAVTPGLRWAAAVALAAIGLALFRARRRRAVGASSLALAAAIVVAPACATLPGPALATLASTVWMAVWWISAAAPLAATSLLPLVLFPALGVLPGDETAASYANENIFLFLGGFVLALGVQRWNLHRRIALRTVRAVGSDLSRMVLGFMLASALMSMWISNTATALMMLPIALAVIAELSRLDGRPLEPGFAPALLLGVGYAASIGGLATPIGTPPNIAFLRIVEILYPEAPSISFGQWVVAFLPLVALFLPLAWLLLTRGVHRLSGCRVAAARDVLGRELERLGPMGAAERRMLIVFSLTALLWMTRGDLDFGSVRISGWASLLDGWLGPPFAPGAIHDAGVAIAMAILTFVLPGDPDERGCPRPLMDWQTARRLPWDILLLFGGGFALAAAYHSSGLSEHLARAFAGQVAGAGVILLVLASCLLLTFLTEVTSNTATTQVLLPVLAGAAGAMHVHPLLIMLPATLSASCAFMLPIATPPNAIVFGSGRITMGEMVRAGLWLNLLGAVLVTAVFLLWSAPVLGLDLSGVPAWAEAP